MCESTLEGQGTQETPSILPPLPEELQQSLDILVQVAQILKIDDTTFLSYSTALSRLVDRSFSLTVSLNRLKAAEGQIRDHIALLKHDQQLIKHWMYALDPSTHAEAESTERRREALLKKAKEYHKELEAVLKEMPESPRIAVTQLGKQEEKNKLLEQEIKAKKAKIKAFQGLPPNLELARHELRNAQAGQMQLIQLRESLLRNMAEGVA